MDSPQLNQVPGHQIFIGGFISLRRREALSNANITHIISVMDWKFADHSTSHLISGFKHLHISVDDVDDTNLIERFPRSNAFIEQGLSFCENDARRSDEYEQPRPGGVLVHCAMGKSRSATIIIAYLLWASRRYRSTTSIPTKIQTSDPNDASRDDFNELSESSSKPLTPDEALALLRQGRPFAEPNDGFMEQLRLYHSMDCPNDVEGHPKYQRWLYQKVVQASIETHTSPDLDYILFEDEHEGEEADATNTSLEKPEIDIKCRKCRQLLARSAFLADHKRVDSSSDRRDPPNPPKANAQECAHLFIHPLSWMKPSLREGRLDGRLLCPNSKCGANVGKFAWQGMRCSCGGWETPGFALARGKIDEVASVKSKLAAEGKANEKALGGNIRLPPSMRKGGGNL